MAYNRGSTSCAVFDAMRLRDVGRCVVCWRFPTGAVTLEYPPGIMIEVASRFSVPAFAAQRLAPATQELQETFALRRILLKHGQKTEVPPAHYSYNSLMSAVVVRLRGALHHEENVSSIDRSIDRSEAILFHTALPADPLYSRLPSLKSAHTPPEKFPAATKRCGSRVYSTALYCAMQTDSAVRL